MATSNITNTITDPSGTAVTGVVVTATLTPGPGFRADGTEVARVVTATSNGSGVWTLALERTANITPANSYYVINEAIPASAGGASTWAIQVGSGDATLQASLISPPAAQAALSLSQYQADGRYERLFMYNVKRFGAQGDGVTDDTAAIQAAINACPPGSTVFLPGASNYVTTSPQVQLAGVTLESQSGRRVANPGSEIASAAYIRPSASFSSSNAAVIRMLDKEQGSYSSENNGQRIKHLNIDCSNITGSTCDGVKAEGFVHDVQLENVFVYKAPHNGITTTSYTRLDSSSVHPYSWTLNNVCAKAAGNIGFSLNGLTDSDLFECEAIGSGTHGFFLASMANSHATACRSEFSGGHGFYISSSWGTGTGSGGMVFVGLSTDRNHSNGVLIDATGSGQLAFAGITCRRDGANGGSGGGSFAGFKVSSATMPVQIDGLLVYPGVADDGTGTNSPQIAFVASGSTWVALGSGYLHGATTGFSDGGSNTTLLRGPNVGEATGTTASPTRVTATSWNADQAVFSDGVTTKVKAGSISDTDFAHTPASGTIAVDTTNNKIYVRVGSSWKSVTVS